MSDVMNDSLSHQAAISSAELKVNIDLLKLKIKRNASLLREAMTEPQANDDNDGHVDLVNVRHVRVKRLLSIRHYPIGRIFGKKLKSDSGVRIRRVRAKN